MLSKNTLEVGAEVEAMCTKCKGPSIHVIEVIKNDKITKVLCKSCLSTHKYKPVESEKDAPKTRAKKSTTTQKAKAPKKATKTKEERQWSRLLTKADAEEVDSVEYAMNASYSELDVINHQKFGVGVVVKVLETNKISVGFQEGTKTLVQNM